MDDKPSQLQRAVVTLALLVASLLSVPPVFGAADASVVFGSIGEPITIARDGKDSTDAACGIYALFAAARQIGRADLDLADLLKPEYLSGRSGSSVVDLQASGADHNLETRALTRLSVADVRWGHAPILLHVRSRPWVEHYDHWICVTQVEGDHLTAYDPLDDQSVRLTWQELASRFDGAALEVYKEGDDLPPVVLKPSTLFLVFSTVVIAVLLGLASTFASRRSPATVPTAAALLIAGGCWGIGTNAVDVGGLLHGPSATRDVDAWQAAAFVHYVSQDELQRMIDRGGVELVDARDHGAFEAGHIPGASSIPALEAKSTITAKMSSSLQGGKPVVVYCVDDHCGLAASLAERFTWEGVANVSVLKGGYVEWMRHHTP